MSRSRSRSAGVNLGSAGPRRFKLPVTLARVVVAGRELRPEIVILQTP
jgi:hypothetical protein